MSDFTLEQFIELQKIENNSIAHQFREHQRIGYEWIKLFKKFNSDRMDEILLLKTRIGVLEKMLVEPQAQSLVDAVGSRYKPIRHECQYCKRPIK